jgi:hypothetical protein
VKSTLKNNGYPRNVFGEIEKKRARREQVEQVNKKMNSRMWWSFHMWHVCQKPLEEQMMR